MMSDTLHTKARWMAVSLLAALAGMAVADDMPEFTLVIKDHVYQPNELHVPAGAKIRIIVRNEDATP
jgi:hypothetical protein